MGTGARGRLPTLPPGAGPDKGVGARLTGIPGNPDFVSHSGPDGVYSIGRSTRRPARASPRLRGRNEANPGRAPDPVQPVPALGRPPPGGGRTVRGVERGPGPRARGLVRPGV